MSGLIGPMWRWGRWHPSAAGIGGVVVVAVILVGSLGDAGSTQTASRTAARSAPISHPAPPTTPPAPSPPAARRSTTPVAAAAGSHPGTALAALATIPVRPAASMAGYSRAEFGEAWSDDTPDPDGHNGCDTRNDILRRDLVDLVMKAGSGGCSVASGVLHDPYGGSTIDFVRGADSAVVQVDHVVALGDAWTTGAAAMTATERIDFAEDPLELLAALGRLNDEKGDADAAGWLPPDTAGDCPYVARQIAVKSTWHLWVTAAEKAAMTGVLDRCPSQRLPPDGLTALAVGAPVATVQATSGSTPATVAAPTPTHSAPAGVVHAGAFCAPAGAHGYTDTGRYEVCGTTPNSPTRNRWHAAG